MPSLKLNVRGLSELIMEELARSAARNERSVEGEARYALRAYVEGPAEKPVDALTNRAQVVGGRLGMLVDELSRLRGIATPSAHSVAPRLARAAGWTHAGPLESWIAGEAEPSFAELDTIAELTGCSADWLAYGDGVAFPHGRLEPHQTVEETLRELLDYLPRSDEFYKYELAVIRCDTEEGQVAFLLRRDHWRSHLLWTNYELSATTKASKLTELACLAALLQRLTQGKMRRDINVVGYQVSPVIRDALVAGDVHPQNALHPEHFGLGGHNTERSVWHEDIWDRSMSQRREYWPGFNLLCQQIEQHVEGEPELRKVMGWKLEMGEPVES